jgi:hypothetical protein
MVAAVLVATAAKRPSTSGPGVWMLAAWRIFVMQNGIASPLERTRMLCNTCRRSHGEGAIHVKQGERLPIAGTS